MIEVPSINVPSPTGPSPYAEPQMNGVGRDAVPAETSFQYR
jgi:hypothetical protein